MTEFVGLFDTARDYTLQFTIGHSRSSQSATVFTSRCLVAASTVDVLLLWVNELSPCLSY
jgi:hypothetical protein